MTRRFIKLHEDVAAMVGDREDLDLFVNSLILSYLSGEFFRKADVAGIVTADCYLESYDVGVAEYDAVTGEFEGVTIIGEKRSQSLFIPNRKLFNLLSKHQLVAVLKSPRTEGISVEKIPEIVMVPQKDELI